MLPSSDLLKKQNLFKNIAYYLVFNNIHILLDNLNNYYSLQFNYKKIIIGLIEN